jgi:hypothetical protein
MAVHTATWHHQAQSGYLDFVRRSQVVVEKCRLLNPWIKLKVCRPGGLSTVNKFRIGRRELFPFEPAAAESDCG